MTLQMAFGGVLFLLGCGFVLAELRLFDGGPGEPYWRRLLYVNTRGWLRLRIPAQLCMIFGVGVAADSLWWAFGVPPCLAWWLFAARHARARVQDRIDSGPVPEPCSNVLPLDG